MDRVAASDAVGWTFESSQARQMKKTRSYRVFFVFLPIAKEKRHLLPAIRRQQASEITLLDSSRTEYTSPPSEKHFQQQTAFPSILRFFWYCYSHKENNRQTQDIPDTPQASLFSTFSVIRFNSNIANHKKQRIYLLFAYSFICL